MTIITSIKNFITSRDSTGFNINLKHKNSTCFKSFPGGLITLIINAFIVYCVFYFGDDLWLREEPTSLFTKGINNSTPIYLKDYPTPISFTDQMGVPYDNVYRYITVVAYWYLMDYEPYGLKGTNYFPLIVEPCTAEHVSQYGDLFRQDVYFDRSYCVNQNKFINTTRTSENQMQSDREIFFQNEFASMNSSFISYYGHVCINSTDNGNSCAPQSEIDSFLDSLNVIYSYLDSYVNLYSYDNPSTYYLNRWVSSINKYLSKTVFHRVKNTRIMTDSGILMQDDIFDEKKTLQYDRLIPDVMGVPNSIFDLIIEGTRIQDIHYRSYIKVQDIIANVGGLLSFMLTISNMLLSPFQEIELNLQLLNRLYEIESTTNTNNNTKLKIESFNELKDCSSHNINQNIIKNNFMGFSQKLKEFKEVNASLIDFFKAKLGCRSRHCRSAYNLLNEYIESKYELLEYIKTSNRVEVIGSLLLTNETKILIKEKHKIKISDKEVASIYAENT
jgi:hypothetical protein